MNGQVNGVPNGYAIPWARPQFWGNEREYILEALDSSWISGGPFVERLEEGVAQYCRVRHAVATSNGTTALHLAYLAAGIGAGDEVIVPGFCFMAAANVAIHMGALPVFAEVDRETWCMTASAVEERLSPRTKAIVPVHTYGNICAMDEIADLARRKGITVIEDAAEAFGSTYKGRFAGAIAELGTYSLHATKTITTGEGGMVVSGNAELRRKMLLYRSHGMGRTRYWHDVVGHNFRLTNMQAALGCAQLEQISKIVAERKRVFDAYRCLLGDFPGLAMQSFPQEVTPVVWVVAVELDPSAFPQGRDAVMSELAAAGIETRPGFYTPARMDHLYACGQIPVCNGLSDRVIALPSFPSLGDDEIRFVCSSLRALRR